MSDTTREGLLTAAAAVFDRDGYVRATLDDVCDRAGVTKGALYGYFSSKRALAVAVLDYRALEWTRTRERLHRSPGCGCPAPPSSGEHPCRAPPQVLSTAHTSVPSDQVVDHPQRRIRQVVPVTARYR